MSYIGNQPTSVAFLTDTFSGNASATTFTLSAAPATTSSIIVAVSGVLQDPSTYAVAGTTLTFSAAPPTGTSNISVRFLGIPASGVTTTAYRTVTEFTATSGQTTFSVPSYTVGFIDVYRNGVLLGSADYTATSGVSVVLVNGCTVGDLVEVISFQVSSVLNAVSPTGGTFSGNVLFGSGNGIWNTSGNVGIGTSSPSYKIDVTGQGRATTGWAVSSDGSTFTPSGLNAIPNYGTGFITSTSYTTFAGFGGISYYTNQTERMRIDGSGNLLFNSGYGSVATAYGCRAWVNFNGTGTVAIRASGNVSSITDNGTGDYTVNFSNAMPDANYSGVGLTSTDSTNSGQMPCLWTIDSTQTTSAFRVRTGRTSIPGVVLQGLADLVNINVAFFR
jgi:hypothetical protein